MVNAACIGFSVLFVQISPSRDNVQCWSHKQTLNVHLKEEQDVVCSLSCLSFKRGQADANFPPPTNSTWNTKPPWKTKWKQDYLARVLRQVFCFQWPGRSSKNDGCVRHRGLEWCLIFWERCLPFLRLPLQPTDKLHYTLWKCNIFYEWVGAAGMHANRADKVARIVSATCAAFPVRKLKIRSNLLTNILRRKCRADLPTRIVERTTVASVK